MGCNLCTLQKREEHYKLLYEIAQVSAGGVAIGVLNLTTAEEESVKQGGDGGEGIFFGWGKTADRLSVEKPGEEWERDLIEM